MRDELKSEDESEMIGKGKILVYSDALLRREQF